MILALSLMWRNRTLLFSAILSDAGDANRGMDTSTSLGLHNVASDAARRSNDASSLRHLSLAFRASRSDNSDRSSSYLTQIDSDRDVAMVQEDDKRRAVLEVDMLPRIAMDQPVAAIKELHIMSCWARMSSILD